MLEFLKTCADTRFTEVTDTKLDLAMYFITCDRFSEVKF